MWNVAVSEKTYFTSKSIVTWINFISADRAVTPVKR